MPLLTPEEAALLTNAPPGKTRTQDGRRINTLLSLSRRLLKAARRAQRLTAGYQVAAFGIVGAADIVKQDWLADNERTDLLALCQLHLEAAAWRKLQVDLINDTSSTEDPTRSDAPFLETPA